MSTQLIREIYKLGLSLIAGISVSLAGQAGVTAQSGNRLTPIPQRIEVQRQRLASSDIEERRDALMKLGAMKHPDASRAAISALNDVEPIIRVTAAHALEALSPSDAAAALIPLLADKQEIVRREAAQALGATRSRTAVQPLVELLSSDKQASVRAAAAMALGKTRDEAAVVPLANMLSGRDGKKTSKTRENEFVMRAAARSLGEIQSRAAVPALITTLDNDANPIDVRRTAAESLGAIGDSAAAPALKLAADSTDPYLSQAARVALRRLHQK